MATTPTRTPETTDRPAPSSPTVRLPDSAVIRPVPPVRTTPAPAPTTRGFWFAIAGLVALLLIAFGVIVWQQSRVDDASTEASNSGMELQASLIESEALQAEVDGLERQLARAETRTEGLERRAERLEAALNASASQGATLDQTQAELAQTEQELAETQAALATSRSNEASARAAYEQARDDLYAIAGTPLADGPWTGRLTMVGGTQVPPMLAFDEMKLFRGDEAIDAMIADGVPVGQAEACGPDCTYWRNPESGWRIMTIAADATIRLKTFQDGRQGPTTMGLQKFSRLFNGTAPQNAHFASTPYRLTVSGGEVTAIEELTVPW